MYKIFLSFIIALNLQIIAYSDSVLVRNISHQDIIAKAIMVMRMNLIDFKNDVVVVPEETTVNIGDECPECKGTGKQSTDGKVLLDCVWCDGDGHVDKGDPILKDTDPQPKPKKPKNPLAKPSNRTVIIQDSWGDEPQMDTYSFTLNNNRYYYVQAPNVFYCIETKRYIKADTDWYKKNETRACDGQFCAVVDVFATQVPASVLNSTLENLQNKPTQTKKQNKRINTRRFWF